MSLPPFFSAVSSHVFRCFSVRGAQKHQKQLLNKKLISGFFNIDRKQMLVSPRFCTKKKQQRIFNPPSPLVFFWASDLFVLLLLLPPPLPPPPPLLLVVVLLMQGVDGLS
jgi:hypothetical protein